jgi:DNA-binding NtrC family response regulator
MQPNIDSNRRPIYFADNNTAFVKSFLHYLNGAGSDVKTFSNGGELVGALTVQPALLIINSYFDNGTGIDLAYIAREHYSDLTIVLILETDSIDLQKKAVKVSPLCSLIMPIDFRDLKDIILKAGGING